MGGCQNYGPLLGAPKYLVPYHTRDPKRDHNFNSYPCAKSVEAPGDLQSIEKIGAPGPFHATSGLHRYLFHCRQCVLAVRLAVICNLYSHPGVDGI